MPEKLGLLRQDGLEQRHEKVRKSVRERTFKQGGLEPATRGSKPAPEKQANFKAQQ